MSALVFLILAQLPPPVQEPRQLVFCTITGCEPCLRQAQVLKGSLPVLVLTVKDQPEYFAAVGAARFPTLVLAEADGTIIRTHEGYLDSTALLRWMSGELEPVPAPLRSGNPFPRRRR